MTGINYRESGARLRVLRQYFGLPPKMFAEWLGLTTSAYTACERGRRRSPGWSKLIEPICNETDVSLDWLFTGESNVTGKRDDKRPVFMSPFRGRYSTLNVGQLADYFEEAWLSGRMEQVIAELRAGHAADEEQRQRASVEVDGNVLSVDFIKGSGPRAVT